MPEPPRHASSRSGAEKILLIQPWEIPTITRAETIGLVEEEVQRLRETIRRLHTHHNALVPFSRLPKELTTRIFGYLMPSAFILMGLNVDIPKRWIAFAQTCSLWRRLALESHLLWSNLYITSKKRQDVKLFANMFARCGTQCLISIQADITHRSSGYYRHYGRHRYYADTGNILQEALTPLEKALDDPSRLRALDLLAPRAQLELLASTIIGPTPNLKSLRLAMPPSDFKDANEVSAVLMDGLEAPGLRHLHLVGTSSSWMRIAGPNMTHLLITSLRPKVSGGDLLDLLRRLPALAVLHLEDMLTLDSSQSDVEQVHRGPVHLRMASQIVLIEPMGACAEILREFELPRTCSIRVDCGHTSTDPPPASDAADELVALLMVHLRHMRGTLPLNSFELDSASNQLHLLCTAFE